MVPFKIEPPVSSEFQVKLKDALQIRSFHHFHPKHEGLGVCDLQYSGMKQQAVAE